MRLKNFLIAVKDIDLSQKFYKELFGLDIVSYNPGTVILTGGLVLQDKQVWEESLGKEIIRPNHAALLYFEEPDIENFLRKLESQDGIEYVTPFTELPWGQKMLRIYDPDGNLIEVRTPG